MKRPLMFVSFTLVFAAGLIVSRYIPMPNQIQAGQAFTVAPSDDGQAAQGVVEVVAVQDHVGMKRMILRARTPNETAARAITVAMGQQGLTFWRHKRQLTHILDADGWVYMWGIFVPSQ